MVGPKDVLSLDIYICISKYNYTAVYSGWLCIDSFVQFTLLESLYVNFTIVDHLSTCPFYPSCFGFLFDL